MSGKGFANSFQLYASVLGNLPWTGCPGRCTCKPGVGFFSRLKRELLSGWPLPPETALVEGSLRGELRQADSESESASLT